MWRLWRTSTERDPGSWSVLALLAIVVLVPTVCLLWFMSAAMENERLAVREKLADAYRTQLAALEARLALSWQERLAVLEARRAEPARTRFASSVRTALADAVVIAPRDGQPGYPDTLAPPAPDPSPFGVAGMEAERQERAGEYIRAAAAYRAIARNTGTPHSVAARALQAAARCNVRAGDRGAALRLLTEELAAPRYAEVADDQGRLIAPSAQLLALELIADPARADFRSTADRLRTWLADYERPLPSVQRRFLMKQLVALDPQGGTFDTLAAEELAARYASSFAEASTELVRLGGELQDVWQLAAADGTVIALFSQDTLLARMREVLDGQALPADTTIELLPPGAQPSAAPFATLEATGGLDGFTLALHLARTNPFDAVAKRRIAAYGWTGALAIASILILAGLIVRVLRRQLRLTRLKNDLLATVSHELKTPLASMRLLVDTLLDGTEHDGKRVGDYLRLIAQENVRLSRLVDNFLTFSRMERNKQQFERAALEPAALVGEAASSIGERFASPDCRFEVAIDRPLPPIIADRDAMLTVLLNLLDNAYKYSDGQKHIVLSAYARNGSVCFAVADRGIGLSTRAARRVFERFYQVDQRLSRRAGGCGLGLSIVQFIVRAHGGSVDVESQPGHGSTFTVRLPAATAALQRAERPA